MFVLYSTSRYSIARDRMGAYEIRRKADNARVYFQPGDDANTLDAEWEAFDNRADAAASDEIFNYLMSQYDEVMKVEG